MGAGVGGMPAAYDLKKVLGRDHEVVLVGTSEHFQFTPSNPWVAVGWRTPDQVLVPIRPNVERKGIRYHSQPVTRLAPQENMLQLADGETVDYDYLVIATGSAACFPASWPGRSIS
jgi:sulfide:quinone oxidoreductase